MFWDREGCPLSFAGHLRGPGAILPSLVAVMVYGTLMGGFVVLAAAGALSGWFAHLLLPEDSESAQLVAGTMAVFASAAGVLLLATLHLIIGPW